MASVRHEIKQAFENCYALTCKVGDIRNIKREFDGMGDEFFTFTLGNKGTVWVYFPRVNCVCIND